MGQLTATGYQLDRYADYKDRVTARLIEEFGSGFVTTDDNPIMRVIGIALEQFSLLDEGLQSSYFSQYPSTATGISLDYVAEITGVSRQIALPTTVMAYAAGTGGTIIPLGSICSVAQTGDQFESTLAVTLTNLPDAAISSLTQTLGVATATSAGHPYSNGDYVFITDADQPEYNGVFPIYNVLTNTFDFDVSSSAVSPATGTINSKIATAIPFQSISTGPIVAAARSLNTIENPVTGWDLIENYLDGNLGRDVETDAEFRARRTLLLAKLGGGTIEAIRAELLDVAGVSNVKVFENATGFIDIDGRPPHSVEAFVTGGVDASVALALYNSVSGGIETYGTQGPFTVTDSEGIDHFYKFSRLTEVLIHVYMKIIKNADVNEGPLYPATGDADIRASILDYGATRLSPGQDLRVTPYIMAAIGAIDGVDIVELYVVKSTGTLPGDPANPGNLTTTITIGATEIATFESVKIWINGATA